MLEDIRIFVKVVQLAGFTKAARLLKLPISTVSRTISRLEEESGTKLLLRTTRSLKPTAAGLAFYESCLGPVQSLEDARQSLSGQDSMLVGSVRLTAPDDFGPTIVAAVVGRLMLVHPGLSFNLHYSDRIVDLVTDGFDLAVRLGPLRTSSLVARRVGEVALIVVASPAYLAKNPPVEQPGDLRNLTCLTSSSSMLLDGWELHSGARSMVVPIEAKVACNQMGGLINLALLGVGVAYVPSYLCEELLREGKLVRVLPEWSGQGVPVSIVSTPGTGKSVRHRLVAEHLAAEIAVRLASA